MWTFVVFFGFATILSLLTNILDSPNTEKEPYTMSQSFLQNLITCLEKYVMSGRRPL